MPGDIIMDSASRNAEIVSNHLKRIGCEAVAKAVSGRITIDYMLAEKPEVSIIIPNKDHCTDLRSCISSIIDKSTYKNYRILIIDNASSERDILNYYDTLQKNYSNIEVYFYQKRFNFPEIINFGVSKSKSEYLVFLNNDTEVITPGWLEMMVGICRRNDIGAVGVKLYYPDGRIQHAGIVLGAGGIAANAYRCFEGNAEGYMNNLMTIRNVSAVTAACMMTKKTLFNSVGGFEEKLAVAFNDVDYCLKLRKKGYLIVWTPFVELYHHESKTREPDGVCGHKNRFAREIDFMRKKWGPVLCNDPYHNKHIPIDRLVHL